MTNADKIKRMTNKELADWLTDGEGLCGICIYSSENGCKNPSCKDGVFEWLNLGVQKDE